MDYPMINSRKTLFLVDDDMTTLKTGKDALTAYYKVITLNSGKKMLDMIEKVCPDLILLDVNMPEFDGYMAIKHLKANEMTEHIPVIFLTASRDEQMELDGLSLGAVDYITKPFSTPLLLKRIEVHLLIEAQRKELLFFNNHLQQLVNEKAKTVITLKNAIISTMAEIIEYRDGITGTHIIRTQRYVKVIIESMIASGLYDDEVSKFDVDMVLQSSQLHDVGKIAISDTILRKPARLTHDEFEIVKTHTLYGEDIILRLREKAINDDFLEYARVIAVTHHEKWDGSGYPKGLAGKDIPLLGRIMAIADVYDALVDVRPYKDAIPHREAVKIIHEGKGSHFDPMLIDLFMKSCHKFESVLMEVRE